MSSGNAVEVIKEKINSFLEKHPQVDGPLKQISSKVGVDKAYCALAIAALPLLIIISLGTGNFVIDLVGFAYPVYASIKAIETQEKEDDTQWLTYWLIFALFKVVEGVADYFISSIPFYYLIKMAFLVWCFYPASKGATVIYNLVIKPYVVPHLGFAETEEKKTN